MTRTKILFYILTLGFITPIGIIVGMVLTLDAETALDPTQSIAVGVLQVIMVNIYGFIIRVLNLHIGFCSFKLESMMNQH